MAENTLKILHTSDWHLGHTLYGRKRYDEFRLFLRWLTQTIREEAADVLLVSGDIFDSGLPSNQAQAMYYDFLREVAGGLCRHLVLIAGNHDSPSFLDAPQAILKAMDIHVVGRSLPPEDEVLLLRDKNGMPELIVCAVPFLRDRDLYRASLGDSVEDRERLLAQGMRDHYRRCAEQAEKLRAESAACRKEAHLPPYIPIIAMGHLFAAGSTVADSDGVRDLRIGSLGQVDAGIFPSVFDYVALGHLHIAQKVHGEDRIRYSGSPLPMGFNEAQQKKKVFLVECGTGLSVRGIEVPAFQRLEKICGDLPAIEARLKELASCGEPVCTEVIYTGEGIVSDLRERLLEKAGAQVELLRVRTARSSGFALAQEQEEQLEDLSVADVFERLLKDVEEQNGLAPEQKEALEQTYREAVNDFFQMREEASCAS